MSGFDLARASGEVRILVSDVDGTLLDSGRPTWGLGRLREVVAGSRGLLRVVYATGRTFSATWEHVASGVLPEPAAVAALVGTELWLPDWSAPDVGFWRTFRRGWCRDAVLGALSDLEVLTLQPPEHQSGVKVSYFLHHEELAPDIEARLRQREVRGKVLFSGGRFLDVIPERAGKAAAVEHLLRRWGLPRSSVLAAGDSGNDLDLLAHPDFLGVAVGNARPELQSAIEDDESVHMAALPFAQGVLEGGEALGFWPEEK